MTYSPPCLSGETSLSKRLTASQRSVLAAYTVRLAISSACTQPLSTPTTQPPHLYRVQLLFPIPQLTAFSPICGIYRVDSYSICMSHLASYPSGPSSTIMEHYSSNVHARPHSNNATGAKMQHSSRPLLLPSSIAALDAAFYSPAPFSSVAERVSNSNPMYLTRSYLQNDESFRESLDLRSLVGTIFAYSDRLWDTPVRPSEIATGYRYFMPNGRLAYEWVQVFKIVPGRYLQMTPPDVAHAFLEERYWVPCSMEGWVREQLFRWMTENEGRSSQEYIDQLIPVNQAPIVIDPSEEDHSSAPATSHSRRKMTLMSELSSRKRHFHESASQETQSTSQDAVPAPDIPSGKKKARHTRSFNSRIPRLVTPHMGRAVPGSVPLPTAVPKVSVPAAPPRPAPLRVRRGTGPRNFPPPTTASTVPVPAARRHTRLSSSRIPRPAPPHIGGTIPGTVPPPTIAPTVPVLAAPQPALTPQTPAVPAKRQAQNFPPITHVPGSVTHTGRGQVTKYWNLERIRAFMNIEGHPYRELPITAFSIYGDEHSRGHTPKSVDPRCCPFDTTVEELLTVSHIHEYLLLLMLIRIQYLTLASSTNRELLSRVKASWTAQQMVHYVVSAKPTNCNT
jgi:hypothetical protein